MESSNKVIAKNTIALYIKMFVLLAIGIYSSRITINVLGEINYGVYNTVAGIVVFFQFFNTSFTNGVQRYLNYYLGLDDKEGLKKIFSQSFYFYLIIAVIITILSETLGLLMLENYLDIPNEILQSIRIVYQLSIISTFFSIMQLPFNATIIAYEKMSFYAVISIFDGIIKLIIPFALISFGKDKLVLYALLSLISIVLQTLFYYLYSKTKFDIINFKFYKDYELFKELVRFSGWNIAGHLSSTLCSQSNGYFVNHYFGAMYSGATVIATTLSGYIGSLLSNFQSAFSPQLIKSYAKGDKGYTVDFAISMTKYSFMLIYFIMLPFLVNYDFVVNLWLGYVPDNSFIFCLFLCLTTLIQSLAGPLWVLVDAEGDIQKYEIASCINGFLSVIVSLVFYSLGSSIYVGYLVNVVFEFLFLIYRLFYLKNRINFPILEYIKRVIIKVIIIVPTSVFIVYSVKQLLINEIVSFFVNCITSCVVLVVLYILLFVSKSELNSLAKFIKERLGFKNE